MPLMSEKTLALCVSRARAALSLLCNFTPLQKVKYDTRPDLQGYEKRERPKLLPLLFEV